MNQSAEHAVSATLLQTKLIPPAQRPQYVPRQRLDQQLQRALEVPLTLVSASAGFGKTTATVAAAQALQEKKGFSLAWLSLDSADSEPSRFWRYFLAGLQRVTEAGDEVAAALTSPQPPPLTSLLTLLLNEIAVQRESILYVLDDYHLIDSREVQEGIAFLVEHAPPNLHLLLASRADPPLPLHRWRAKGQLAEVRAATLRFDLDEASTLLTEAMGLSLTEEEVALLHQQTEGWAAGLQLAGLALQGAPSDTTKPGLVQRLAHSNRYVAEYLAEEILAQQPVRVQSFLLQTSILDRLCGPLCDALTQDEDGQALLAELARRNLFLLPIGVPPTGGEQEQWYRYHHLFAELLEGQLRARHPEQVAILHQRAASWYESQGDLEQAVEHALDGADYARVVRLLDSSARVLAMEGQALTMERWLRRLPELWRQALPRATLTFCWALLLRGRYEEINAYLDQVERALGGEPEPSSPLLGELYALQAALDSVQGQAARALERAREAIAIVPEDNLLVQALAHFALASAQRESGDVVAAIVAYEQAIPLCRAARLPLPEMLARAHLSQLYTLQGQLRQAEAVTRPAVAAAVRHPASNSAQLALAGVLLEWNRLPEARQHIEQALAQAKQTGHNAAVVQGHLILSRLERAEGDLPAARAALEVADTERQHGVPSWIEPLLLAERVQLWLQEGGGSQATHLLAELERAVPDNHLGELLLLTRAHLLYHNERHQEAQHLLDEALQTAEAGGRQGRVIEALVLRALVQEARADSRMADEALGRALTLAEPEGYVRRFVEMGPDMAPLLARLNHPYARQLLQAFPATVRAEADVSTALPEPLTEREREVLQRMARGLTYQQIADELVVSVNTVRHHVKGLYGKLQVNRRSQAVERARALNLL